MPPKRVRLTLTLSRAINDAMVERGLSSRDVASRATINGTPISHQTVQNYAHHEGEGVNVSKVLAVLAVLGLEDRWAELVAEDRGEWRMPSAFDSVPAEDRERVEEFLAWVFADHPSPVTDRARHLNQAAEPDTLNYEQAARHLGISTRSLRRLVADGTVRFLQPIPRQVRFLTADLDAYLESTARGGRRPKRGARRQLPDGA